MDASNLTPEQATALVTRVTRIRDYVGRVAERILDPANTSEIHEIIERGEAWGMQTFDRHLLQLVKDGTVTVEDAFTAATNPHDFELSLQQAGLVVPA